MAKYRAKGRYAATFTRNGSNEAISFAQGDEVELDDEQAAYVKRDCPKILVRAQGTTSAARKRASKKG